MIPVFLDLRLDLDVRRKVSPYLDMKIGYQFGSTLNKNRVCSNRNCSYLIRPESGMYLHPSIGLRFRVNDRYAINFGFSYDVDIKRKLIDPKSFGPESSYDTNILSSMRCKAFAFNVGFDF